MHLQFSGKKVNLSKQSISFVDSQLNCSQIESHQIIQNRNRISTFADYNYSMSYRFNCALSEQNYNIQVSKMRFIASKKMAIVTRFGKVERLVGPGMRFYVPIFEELHEVSNRLSENHCSITIRTSDKVFPKLDISIQYHIMPEDSVKAFFELADPLQQMNSYVDNIVRKTSSSLTLDELFESQSHLADAIISEVGPRMKEAGFTIQSVQIRNIVPPEEIMKSMNEINAAERRRTAAQFDGQAAKIKAVLMAEADAKEKELRGKGIANMRANITEGWVQSIKQMAERAGITPRQVMTFLTKILQQQTMQTMSKNAGTKVIFVDKGQSDSTNQFIQAMQAHNFKAQNDGTTGTPNK